MQRSIFVPSLLVAMCWVGCSPKPSASAKQPLEAGKATTNVFQVKGVVHNVMPDKNKVTIAHEKIPGYMDAMTMDFDVKKPTELGGIKPGDNISFRMVVTDNDGWIEKIVKLNTNSPQAV